MNKFFKLFLCLVLCVFCAYGFFGCSNEKVTLDPVKTEVGDLCLVTVIGGNGGGNYLSGSNVMVSPIVPEGKQFMYWSVDGEAVSSNDEYVFVVTKDTTLTAVFSDDVQLSNAQGFKTLFMGCEI